jgi:uncharacterized protein (TIGR02217 family)
MFINERLLDRVSYGFSGGPTFRTTKVELRSGIVNRNAEISQPLYRFAAPYDKINEADHSTLLDAYIACLGPVHSFRFRDYSDYVLINEDIGVAAVTGPNDVQLTKTYTFGPESVVRIITKPISTGWTAQNNGVPTTITVDDLTGIATIEGVMGETITVSGQFDVPVFFIDDDLTFVIENWKAHTTDIGLMEDIQA